VHRKIDQSIDNLPHAGNGYRPACVHLSCALSRYAWASVKVDGASHRGGMLGSGSMGAMRSCLNEILHEFQEGSLGGGKKAAENILHNTRSLNLDLRSNTSCTTCGVLTLT
jgi:hypothetical protein